ncbi:MAG: hypothetical protein HKL90_14000, partial [Elusimicrobia bacterium]|nr:hypothetical protein [Elusimicrobiota bacterium]
MTQSGGGVRRASPAMREVLDFRLGEEAERLGRSAQGGGEREDWRGLADGLRSELSRGTLTVNAPDIVASADGASARRTALYGAREILLMRALRGALDGLVDAEFLPESAGAGR